MLKLFPDLSKSAEANIFYICASGDAGSVFDANDFYKPALKELAEKGYIHIYSLYADNDNRAIMANGVSFAAINRIPENLVHEKLIQLRIIDLEEELNKMLELNKLSDEEIKKELIYDRRVKLVREISDIYKNFGIEAAIKEVDKYFGKF